MSMGGVLWTHKTSNLRLSFRVLDVLQTFLLNCFGRTYQQLCSLPTKIPRTFEQSIPPCIEDLPILPFLSCRKHSLGDNNEISMNRLEDILLSLYNLFSVCIITGTFTDRQCIGVHFEPCIRGRTEPLCSHPTNTDGWRRQNVEETVPAFSSLTLLSVHLNWNEVIMQ